MKTTQIAARRLLPASRQAARHPGVWLPWLSLTLLMVAALTAYAATRWNALRDAPVGGLSRRQAGDLAATYCKRLSGANVRTEDALGIAGAKSGHWRVECRDDKNRVYHLNFDAADRRLWEYHRLNPAPEASSPTERGDSPQLNERTADAASRKYLLAAEVIAPGTSVTLRQRRQVTYPAAQWQRLYSCTGADGNPRLARVYVSQKDGELDYLAVTKPPR